MNCRNCIYVGTVGAQDVATNGNVLFNRVIKRDSQKLDLMGIQPVIKECGQHYYLVNFNATVSAAATGDIQFVLYQNDRELLITSKTETITTADTEFRTVSINAIIKTPCCPQITSISVQNTGIAAIYTNATLSIVDIDR